jgi:RND family efflux transporter MFP subunit
MWLIRTALRRPITVLMLVLGVGLTSVLALQRMRADILPNLGTPVLYVAQAYGGMDPAQMEGYLTNYYEFHFLYINGIDHVESRSIQDVGLVALYFHPGTDMAQALAETVAQVNRARAFMPPGTVPPVVLRHDAGSLPVGYVTFSSDTRGLNEIQDLALNRVRPQFATLPGVSGRPPLGGNQRTIVVSADPARLRAYGLSAAHVIQAVAKNNVIVPSGYVRVGDEAKAAPVNAVVRNVDELLEIPIRVGAGPSVFLRDVGSVQDTMDILAGYAMVDGRRSVYLPVIKRADASTLDVVNEVRTALPRFRALVPEDITVDFEFDQSQYVTSAIRSLATEGILGAILTGLAVLLFLRDVRGALIVVATIPLALLAAVVGLWVSGQTINIMTLGGLTLAVGILVDESTVAIENMYTHLTRHTNRALAVLDAGAEVAVPQFLAMLCVAAVFTPALFMVGPGRALFVPLALAVALAMAASYVLSRTFVPVLATWLLHASHGAEPERAGGMSARYSRFVARVVHRRWAVAAVYVVVVSVVVYGLGRRIGTEVFPTVDTGELQLRIKAAPGTRVERTERIAQQILQFIAAEAGPANVRGSIGYVGIQPTSFPINTILLWTSGPHEAVLRVALDSRAGVATERIKERLRAALPDLSPGTTVAFEPADVVSQVMSFGASTPIEVAVAGPDFGASRAFAARVKSEMEHIPALRDIQYAQLLEYPSLNIRVDRERAGQLGVTVQDVGQALVAATSSTRFIQPNYWAAPNTGVSYQVQVEVPQFVTDSIESIETIPVAHGDTRYPLVGDVATVSEGSIIGQYDRYNQQRMVTITADVQGVDLGTAARQVTAAIAAAGEAPRGAAVMVRGQVAPMQQTLQGLETGLLLAIAAIFLLLGAYFQSVRMALVVLATIPAAIAGVLIALTAWGGTLNVQSFMGAIVAIGVGVANAILLATFAERARLAGALPAEAAVDGARSRLRPILMTTSAMVLGMVPLAFGAAQTAPLGQAVIGGLLGATMATLLVLPPFFALVQSRAGRRSPSLDPYDPASAFHATAGYALLAVALAGGLGCNARTETQRPEGGAPPAPSSAASSAAPVSVPVSPVVEQPLERTLTLPGDFAAFQDVAIHARVEGFVERINVDRGSVVRRGSLLAAIEAPELQAQLREAEAKVQTADAQRLETEAALASERSTFERLTKAAATPGVVAGNDVDVAERKVDAARARVEAAGRNLEAARQAARSLRDIETYLQVTAPFDGVITERTAHVGSLVGPATAALVRIQQQSPLRLVAPIPEAYVGASAIGRTVSFTVTAFPGKTFAGTLARTSRALDVKTRTMAVELDVANSDGRLAPGMFAEVQWPVRRTEPSLFVPRTAVATTTERSFVIRVRDGAAEWVDVKRGAAMDQLVEVFGELRSGDEVATRATDEIRPGTRVNPVRPASGRS